MDRDTTEAARGGLEEGSEGTIVVDKETLDLVDGGVGEGTEEDNVGVTEGVLFEANIELMTTISMKTIKFCLIFEPDIAWGNFVTWNVGTVLNEDCG